MKKLFTSIRQGKLEEVARILDKKPELISCLAKAPPKKDDGQSPLMVAIKSDNLEVAHLLLDRGADVNFRDAPSQPHDESAPIWYFAVGQCFLRTRHVVEKDLERSKEYFLLLRRLLDMGMDPNQMFTSDSGAYSAWLSAVMEYDSFAVKNIPSYYVEQTKAGNRQLREMLKAVMDELLAHGADIHNYQQFSEGRMPMVAQILRNIEEGRDILDGLYAMDPESDFYKPYVLRRGGKDLKITPSYTYEETRQGYEFKWRELEPVLRAYYTKG